MQSITSIPTFQSPFCDQVKNAILHHPHLKQREVKLETEGGRVTLRGSVHSYFEKQMAQEALRRVAGVDEIENRLNVVERIGVQVGVQPLG